MELSVDSGNLDLNEVGRRNNHPANPLIVRSKEALEQVRLAEGKHDTRNMSKLGCFPL